MSLGSFLLISFKVENFSCLRTRIPFSPWAAYYRGALCHSSDKVSGGLDAVSNTEGGGGAGGCFHTLHHSPSYRQVRGEKEPPQERATKPAGLEASFLLGAILDIWGREFFIEGVGSPFCIRHTQEPNSQHKVDLLPWQGEG